jgi:predicted amidohydrolase YtcJ
VNIDALFVNGRFNTLDPKRPAASSLGVVGGIIVGFDEELQGCTADVRYDLGGAYGVPGFNDAHHHISARGQDLQKCDVSPTAVHDLAALYARVAEHAAALPADAWVLATGYDDSKLDTPPTREGLDAVSGGRPVWMMHCSHHSGTINTEAIHRMGFSDPRDLPDVDGGFVQRLADGYPTGFIAERSVDLVTALLRPIPQEALIAAIARGNNAALADGLTSVTEPGICGTLTGNGPTDLDAFLTAVERGLLTVRTAVMPEISALHHLGTPDGAAFGLDVGLRSGMGDDQLRIGPVKAFADGALTARTAAMSEDYADRAGWRGFLLEDETALRDKIIAAHCNGWRVATHAIGDAAIDAVLDAYEQAQRLMPRPDVRHRVEHCGVASDRQIDRISRLGVIPVPQARFLSELGDEYLRAVGEERGQLLYRQRSFLDAGIELPGSSDCPVVNGEPIKGIHALVNREIPGDRTLNPAEALTPAQALRAFTYGSAYAERQEHRKGTLSRGKLADFVLLSDDVLTIDSTRIGEVEVVATVVGGAVRHGRVAPAI